GGPVMTGQYEQVEPEPPPRTVAGRQAPSRGLRKPSTEEPQPQRPPARPAPSTQTSPAPASASPPARARRQAPAASATEAAQPAPTPGFDGASGPESGGDAAAQLAPDALTAQALADEAAADVRLICSVLGGDDYVWGELGDEYSDAMEFPGIKQWCIDHGLDVPKGRGRIKPDYYAVHKIAHAEWQAQAQAAA